MNVLCIYKRLHFIIPQSKFIGSPMDCSYQVDCLLLLYLAHSLSILWLSILLGERIREKVCTCCFWEFL